MGNPMCWKQEEGPLEFLLKREINSSLASQLAYFNAAMQKWARDPDVIPRFHEAMHVSSNIAFRFEA